MAKVKIENWSIIEGGDFYTAPEMRTKHLSGNIYGHSLHEDGKSVTTSSIIEINLEKGFAKTNSGTHYLLGTIDPNYQKFMGD